jgi:hypothetical protein
MARETRRNHRSWLDEKYLSVPEAASELGVTAQTVRRWCDAFQRGGGTGQGFALQSIKHANRYRVIPREAVAALNERRKALESPRPATPRPSASQLDFLPQLVWFLEGVVGRALAEFLSTPHGDQQRKLTEEARTIADHAKLLLADLERRPRTAKHVGSFAERIRVVEDRMSELIPENRIP